MAENTDSMDPFHSLSVPNAPISPTWGLLEVPEPRGAFSLEPSLSPDNPALFPSAAQVSHWRLGPSHNQKGSPQPPGVLSAPDLASSGLSEKQMPPPPARASPFWLPRPSSPCHAIHLQVQALQLRVFNGAMHSWPVATDPHMLFFAFILLA